jgi:transposase
MANVGKEDTARYLLNRFVTYVQHCVGILFFNGNKAFSTKNCGALFNQAQHKARSIIKALLAAQKETGEKINVPQVKKTSAPCKLEVSKSSSFDYWIVVSNQWTKAGVVRLPVKSTKVLNKALKNGWQFTSSCEIKEIKGKLYAMVFVQKEVEKATPEVECLGIDVGINKSVTRSDGHKGVSLGDKIKKFKDAQRERYRQRMKFGQKQTLKKNNKTYIKQILDIEAKVAVRRSYETGCTLVVESRKIINNLRSGKLSLWARNYFANRCEVLCKEMGVFFLEVSPWKSSQTCSECREIGERNQEVFVCKNAKCSEYLREVDADLNASKELRNRGRQVLLEKIIPKWHTQVAVKLASLDASVR